jgi:hypothetical protein
MDDFLYAIGDKADSDMVLPREQSPLGILFPDAKID